MIRSVQKQKMRMRLTALLILLAVTGCSTASQTPQEAEETMSAMYTYAMSFRETETAVPTSTLAPQNDGGSGADASAANPVKIGSMANGGFTKNDTTDYFVYQYTPGALLDITVKFDPAFTEPHAEIVSNTTVQLTQDPTDKTIYSIKYARELNPKNAAENSLILVVWIGSQPDSNFILYPSADTGNYTINILETPQNDAGSGRDVISFGSGDAPTPIDLGVSQGFVGYDDPCDYYVSPPLQVGDQLKVTVTPDPELDVSLHWIEKVEPPTRTPGEIIYTETPSVENSHGKGEAENWLFEINDFYKMVADYFHTDIRRDFEVCRQEGTAGNYAIDLSLVK